MKKIIIFILYLTLFTSFNQVFANGVAANGNARRKIIKESVFYSLRLANALVKCPKTRSKYLEVVKETTAGNAIAFVCGYFDMHGAQPLVRNLVFPFYDKIEDKAINFYRKINKSRTNGTINFTNALVEYDDQI